MAANAYELTLTQDQAEEVARQHEHHRQAVTQGSRVTKTYPDMTLADAYLCQQAWVDLQVANGAVVDGHKIGLTSRAMQMAMKIHEPDFGTLLDYMFISNGDTLSAADYNDPRIEVELAFVLRESIGGPNVTAEQVLAATEYVVPALELIDARSYRVDPNDGVTRTVKDTISDNAANAGIIVGNTKIDVDSTDLRWVGAICKLNGTVEESGLAAAVLDDPVQGIVWLARRLSDHGVELEAGETVLAGSFTRPVMCRPGDEFHVDFGPHGVIELAFS